MWRASCRERIGDLAKICKKQRSGSASSMGKVRCSGVRNLCKEWPFVSSLSLCKSAFIFVETGSYCLNLHPLKLLRCLVLPGDLVTRLRGQEVWALPSSLLCNHIISSLGTFSSGPLAKSFVTETGIYLCKGCLFLGWKRACTRGDSHPSLLRARHRKLTYCLGCYSQWTDRETPRRLIPPFWNISRFPF